MIPSNEANRRTLDILNKKFYDTSKDLEVKIERAISEGLFSISGDGVLPEQIIQSLRELGYTVKISSQFNESCYSISWR